MDQIQVTVEVILGADGEGCYTHLYVKERGKHVLGGCISSNTPRHNLGGWVGGGLQTLMCSLFRALRLLISQPENTDH